MGVTYLLLEMFEISVPYLVCKGFFDRLEVFSEVVVRVHYECETVEQLSDYVKGFIRFKNNYDWIDLNNGCWVLPVGISEYYGLTYLFEKGENGLFLSICVDFRESVNRVKLIKTLHPSLQVPETLVEFLSFYAEKTWCFNDLPDKHVVILHRLSELLPSERVEDEEALLRELVKIRKVFVRNGLELE